MTPPADRPPPSAARRRIFNALGLAALAIGTIGIALPLLPTVPFYILAAYLFGKGNPALEGRLLAHPRFGPHILAWRQRGAISRRGKIASVAMLAASGIIGLLFLPVPWAYVPAAIAVVTGSWLLTRPSA